MDHYLIPNLSLSSPSAAPMISTTAAAAAAAAAASSSSSSSSSPSSSSSASSPSRYEAQKRRDWNTFGQYLQSHRPPLSLSRCSGAHVLEFLRYLDQFGKTKVHSPHCPFFGHPNPPAPCPCPLRQAWGSLDALVGRLRAAFDENGGLPESNPFATRPVRLYLREVREHQSKARGISYQKKKKNKKTTTTMNKQQQQQQQQVLQQQPPPPATTTTASTSTTSSASDTAIEQLSLL